MPRKKIKSEMKAVGNCKAYDKLRPHECGGKVIAMKSLRGNIMPICENHKIEIRNCQTILTMPSKKI